MTTQTDPVQWRESHIAQENYLIQERFPRLRRWQPLPPLKFGWTMKPLASARANFRSLASGQLELTISHDIIKGVTPQMLAWWFARIDDTMEVQGHIYPRYRVWHPLDHIHYRDLSRAPDGTGSAGTRRHIVEAFGADRRYLVNIIDRVLHLDETGILLSTEHAGIWVGQSNMLAPLPFRFSTLEHQFFAHPRGTRYESRLLIGVDSAIGKHIVNRFVRPLFIGEAMARAWLKHNVEEVGNFENFLPALFRTFERQERPGGYNEPG